MPFLLLAAGMLAVLGGVLWLRLHPFVALILAAFLIAVSTPESLREAYAAGQLAAGKMSGAEAAKFPGIPAPKRVAEEFGGACAGIGILIAMAAIIGRCLLRSGAASRVADAMLAAAGPKRAPLGFAGSGFFLGIPVFFDTVFYLLMPLGRALYARLRGGYLLIVLSIVAGATMAHSLVPPTPGPLFVAEELGVGIGQMMLGGTAVGIIAVTAGLLYAHRLSRRHDLAPLPEPGESAEADADPAWRPPLWLAALPVVLPVALLAAGGIAAALAKGDPALKEAAWFPALAFLADKNVALTLAALAALALLVKAVPDRDRVRAEIGGALGSGASILLITAAGAAFGGVLRHTGIALALRDALPGAGVAALPIVFLLTALVRTAQGSATVAMITAAPVAKAFLDAGDLGFHPVYLALAIGCGSKPFPWMNDSGFWVITRMAGLREADTLRFVSVTMSLMGVAGFLAVLAGALLFG